MKATYKLTAKDIGKIIAEYFNVKPENAELACAEECNGYGLGEKYVHVPYAEVKKNE